MRAKGIVGAVVAVILLGAGGWWWWQEQLEPIPLKADAELFEAANPEGEQGQAALQVLAPDSARLRAFLRHQALEPLIEKGEDGYVGLLAMEVWHSRHEKRWRVKPKTGLRLQDGRIIDAAWLVGSFPAWAPAELKADLKASSVEEGYAQFRFQHAQPRAAELLASAPVFDPAQPTLGTGPFRLGQDGLSLTRNELFRHGSAGFASLQVATEPTLMESRAWVEGLAAARWAWSPFPGKVEPDDMAKARNAAYDDVRMKDGVVWFISRRLRRFKPVKSDWTATRLFGVWRADYDLVRKDP
jgi:hypothetical protein